MNHWLRKTLLTTIQDSPFEAFLRRLYGIISPDKGSKYDRETRKVMSRVLNKDSNCIDVGAYRGEIVRDMLKLAPFGSLLLSLLRKTAVTSPKKIRMRLFTISRYPIKRESPPSTT